MSHIIRQEVWKLGTIEQTLLLTQVRDKRFIVHKKINRGGRIRSQGHHSNPVNLTIAETQFKQQSQLLQQQGYALVARQKTAPLNNNNQTDALPEPELLLLLRQSLGLEAEFQWIGQHWAIAETQLEAKRWTHWVNLPLLGSLLLFGASMGLTWWMKEPVAGLAGLAFVAASWEAIKTAKNKRETALQNRLAGKRLHIYGIAQHILYYFVLDEARQLLQSDKVFLFHLDKQSETITGLDLTEQDKTYQLRVLATDRVRLHNLILDAKNS